jgi:hypothetical protein
MTHHIPPPELPNWSQTPKRVARPRRPSSQRVARPPRKKERKTERKKERKDMMMPHRITQKPIFINHVRMARSPSRTQQIHITTAQVSASCRTTEPKKAQFSLPPMRRGRLGKYPWWQIRLNLSISHDIAVWELLKPGAGRAHLVRVAIQ